MSEPAPTPGDHQADHSNGSKAPGPPGPAVGAEDGRGTELERAPLRSVRRSLTSNEARAELQRFLADRHGHYRAALQQSAGTDIPFEHLPVLSPPASPQLASGSAESTPGALPPPGASASSVFSPNPPTWDELPRRLQAGPAAAGRFVADPGQLTAGQPTQALPSPAAPPPPSAPGRTALLPVYRFFASVGGFLMVLGLLAILLVGFQLIGTNWVAARSQHALRLEIERTLASGKGSVTAITNPVPGGAIAIIRIPRVHIDKVVVEGTTVGDLMKAPGHYPGTPLPGQVGNVAIAGHRTTYGAPFFRLDELVAGDDIVTTTAYGTFHYRVTSKPRAVSPNDVAVLNPTQDNRLTLTTCTPAFSASERLIVVAELDSTKPALPVQPTQLAAHRLDPAGSNSVALGGDAHAWPSALLWGILVVAAAWAARAWSRRWRRLPVFLLTAPVIALFLFACFENVNRLLPANL